MITNIKTYKINFLKLLSFILIIISLFCLSSCSLFRIVSEDKLINTRNLIRQSNIAIDTKYKVQGIFTSRTKGEGLGSGVLFYEDDEKYYALTNYHVVTEYIDNVKYITTYTITDINGNEYEGTVEMYNSSIDLAIVSFSKKEGNNLKLINYKKRLNKSIKQKEFVLAIGNPSGVKNIVTYGQVISYANIKNVDYTVIYHNALINPGNSGGALCDLDGNLIGINTWGTENKDDQNFAIPLNIIKEFLLTFNENLY